MSGSPGREFMRRTRHRHLGPSDQQRGAPPPPLEASCPAKCLRTPLPPARESAPGAADPFALMNARQSVRDFADAPLSLQDLADLAWFTQGVKETVHGMATLRTVPSAGARHALETRLLVRRVEGLEPGLYRYLALGHEVALVDASPELPPRICEACLGQAFVLESAVTFVWSAVPYRMAWRYGERAYRYLHLDAGHACQNLYLAAGAVGAGCCAVAAFDDEEINRLLGLDGKREFVIYLASVGRTG